MGRRWIVVDTNIFCFTGYQEAGDHGRRERDYLAKGGEAVDFLHRLMEYCDEYGLAVDTGGLIVEEYQRQIPLGSFGHYAFRQMATRMPGKVRAFDPRNPDWMDQVARSQDLDKHDRRFIATALATPDKVLVSEDTVLLENAPFLERKGLHVYDAEEANEVL